MAHRTSPLPREYDALVLGGGIAGNALAYHLAHEHGWKVFLYERGAPGGGASGKAAGIVSSQCWNSWDVKAVETSRREYHRLSREHDPTLFQTTGGIRVVSTEKGEEELELARARLREARVQVEVLSPAEIGKLLPSANLEGVRAGLHTPLDAVVAPTDLTLLYGRLARENGAVVESDRGDVRAERTGEGWSLSGERVHAEAPRLILACGAWTKGVLSTLGHPLPLAPYLTRACLLKAGQKRAFPWVHDADLDVYVRPFPGGDVLAGDGTELKEVDPEHLTPSSDLPFLENVASFMERRFPKWASASVGSSWHGVCVSTPDRRPLIGAVPGAQGLHVISGFNGFGVMRAGASSRWLADAMAKGSSPELRPVDPARFPLPYPPFEPRPGFTLEP
ncbi:MAG: FAD-binding oxidoreductase [Euryarchaeota archaeon]|nr:FAD-binding oxidoreductase [Euryarchaeota archaeon]